MAGCIPWRWKRSRCKRRGRGLTAIGSFGRRIWISSKNIWSNYKRRKANMMINSEVQKPDDATLVLRRGLNATPGGAFKAWGSPEHITQWGGPETGVGVALSRIDLRGGGE